MKGYNRIRKYKLLKKIVIYIKNNRDGTCNFFQCIFPYICRFDKFTFIKLVYSDNLFNFVRHYLFIKSFMLNFI